MASRLQQDLKQAKPFSSAEEEALLSIARTAACFEHSFSEFLKPFGVTPTQYNVLRILRGAGAPGLCRNEVRDRLVAEVPDVTRLLDRMEEAGLVVRSRNSDDRRVVNTVISKTGLQLLAATDKAVSRSHRQLLGHMGPEKLAQLIELLSEARNPP
jgi:DNA-binding MarR family transcriptional regulator